VVQGNPKSLDLSAATLFPLFPWNEESSGKAQNCPEITYASFVTVANALERMET